MIKIKRNIEVSKKEIEQNLKRLTNQIYKILPLREEDQNWELPLNTIIEELNGLYILLEDKPSQFLTLLCKLEGLTMYKNKEDFFEYRRVIFECLSLLEEIKNELIK